MPIMQGFIGQRSFVVKSPSSASLSREAAERPTIAVPVNAAGADRESIGSQDAIDTSPSFLLTLVSRRSVNRSGLRYLRRGIDDEGNCANTVETEQILSSPMWDKSVEICSFTQIRGSIPLYFSQSPYAFKPVPVLHQSAEVNQKALERHLDELGRSYGSVQIVSLVDKHGGEEKIGREYEN